MEGKILLQRRVSKPVSTKDWNPDSYRGRELYLLKKPLLSLLIVGVKLVLNKLFKKPISLSIFAA
jgi:hypothetical protein